MRTSRSLLFFSALLYLFTTFAAAWPWPVDKILPHMDSLIVREAFRNKRDDSSSSSGKASTQASQTAAASSATETAKSSKSDSTASKSKSQEESGTGTMTSAASTATGKGDSSKSNSTSSTVSIDDNAAAGGLEILVPDTTSGSYFYKISDYVTFAWNYTSLSITPTAVNVYVTCTSNSEMYTITKNMSTDANATQAVTWDTNNYPEETDSPLLTAIYTMYIFDADSSISAEASAGHLSAASYVFGMYTKSPYTPYSEWTCGSCSAALSPDEKRYLKFMLAMVGVTVVSFTWFVGGTGVIW